MLHNKHYWILKHFLGDYNKRVYGRMLDKRIPLSQKAIALTLDELEQMNVLKSEKVGTIKYYKINVLYSEIKEVLTIIEIMSKLDFNKKHRKIANLFRSDKRVIGIFGSYAQATEKSDSDIDVFIIGNKNKKDYEELGRLYDLNISCKYFSETQFSGLLRKKNSLINEIVRRHIILFGYEKWINTLWSEYYGIT